jgi:PAS domain S-box-containing protein
MDTHCIKSQRNTISYAGRSPCDLEEIIEASHDGLFITDGAGNVLLVNSSWERICGIPRAFVIGKNAQDMVDEKLYSESSVMAAIRARKKVSMMLEMTKGGKAGQQILATAIPIWGEAGEIKRVVANIRDITEIISLKRQLEETKSLNQVYEAEIEQMRLQQTLKNFELIARSRGSKQALEMAAQVAKVDTIVLITGESGVGKEVIADTIHRMSHRANGPFIKINCGAIPDNLLESELFGYESGAFTGARKQGKPGMFEMATKGTLFLDEIGDISFNLQGKLLRALQDQKIMRIGGIKPIPVDTRIIAATNKNLQEMVKANQFRDDLYYRLNVVSIEVPPLRDRLEDIPLLTQHFLEKINKRYEYKKRISSGVIDCFLAYHWPGNIRELENVVERMLVMNDDEEINFNHLPYQIKNQSFSEPIRTSVQLKQVVESTEKQLLRQALMKHKSTREIARALNINQSTVVRKIRKYKLALPADRC